MSDTAVVTIPQRQSLVQKFASKYHIEAEKLMGILKATAFKQKNAEVTNEQMAALLVVADQYGLNPFTREIFAFPDKQNGIVPVVGVDGWSRIVNDHPQSDGFEFRESDEAITLEDAKPCPKWMEVVIYRKDRTHPIVVREYLDEVYRPLGKYDDGNKMKPGPWQTHTKRFLRHKTFIQGARIAYGFGGIFDDDEAERIVERDITAESSHTIPKTTARSASERMRDALGGNQGAAAAETSTAGANVGAEAAKTTEEARQAEVTVAADPKPQANATDEAAIQAAIESASAPKASATAPEIRGQKKPVGTPAILKKFLDTFTASADIDVLSAKRDEANMLGWSAEQLATIDEKYRARLAELTGAGD